MNALVANDTLDQTRELQNRLYRAAKRSPARRFHALYDKVHREDFLWRAWVEVARNGGAPGIDGVTITQIEERGVEGVKAFLGQLASELRSGTYRPLAVRRVAIPKPAGGERLLGVPAVRDRVVQAATKLVVEPIFEADFLDCSYGFRPKRSAHMALESVQTAVTMGRVWVVDADIASFFDSIRPEILRQALAERISDRRVLKLIMGWLSAGVLEGRTLLHPEAGTPQGGVISPLLANVVLHRLDRRWAADHWRLGVLVRYADDLVICCPTEERADAALAVLAEILSELGLSLSSAKTDVVDMRVPGAGFDFLGFHHRWMSSRLRKGVMYCARWPSQRSVRAFRMRVRELTHPRRWSLSIQFIVEDLNQFLLGWRGYFRRGNSTTVFHDLDEFVAERVARFITKKHRRRTGRAFGLFVLSQHQGPEIVRLVGSVGYGPVHAAG